MRMPRGQHIRVCSSGVRVSATGWALVLVLAVAWVPAQAIDLSLENEQLILRSWDRSDGLPSDAFWSLALSSDGYLWAASEGGLVRFDGARFTVYNTLSHDAFRVNDVRGVAEAPDGSIWAGTYGGGVVRLSGDDVTRFDASSGLTNEIVFSIHVARDGTVWVGTAAGPCRMRSEPRFECWADDPARPVGRISAIAEGRDGSIWFSDPARGVSRFDGESFHWFGPDTGLPPMRVLGIASDPEFDIVFGTYEGEFYRRDGDTLVALDEQTYPPGNVALSLLRDRDGNIWTGTNANGVWRLGLPARQLGPAAIQSTHVFDLVEDAEGGIWFGTSTGLHQLRVGPVIPWGAPEGLADGTFVLAAEPGGDVWVGAEAQGLFRVSPEGIEAHYTTADGLPSPSVSGLHVADDGTVWIGTFSGGIARLRDGRIGGVLNRERGLADDQVASIFEDSAGTLWVGTAAGMNRVQDGRVTATLTTSDGLLANMVRHINEDRDGNLLLSSDSGLMRFSPKTLQVVETLTRASGLFSDVVATTYIDEDGDVWIGGRNGGLARLSGDTLYRFRPEHGIAVDSIMGIVEDERGSLWLAGRSGIARVERTALAAVAEGSGRRVEVRSLSETDGLRGIRVPGGFQVPAVRSADGRVWFATTEGAAVVDPLKMASATEPLVPLIEAVRVDGERRPFRDGLRLEPGVREIQIDYSVPRINGAEHLEFRYRLAGNGSDWQSAGSRRTAFFTRPGSGLQRFEVDVTRVGQSFDPSGQQVTAFEFTVEPRWFEHDLVRAGFVAGGVLFGLLAYVMVVRRFRARAQHLEGLVSERTAALQKALTEVRRLSLIDPLTQIANRRDFDQQLASMWRSCQANGQLLSCMIVDVDNFKQLNDSQGHHTGDECLQRIAATLAELVREDDVVARLGGDEFAILLRGSDVVLTRRIGERLQARVRELAIPNPGIDPGAVVTVSAGFATAEPGPIDTVEALMQRADKALFEAKEAGRDRLVVDPWLVASAG